MLVDDRRADRVAEALGDVPRALACRVDRLRVRAALEKRRDDGVAVGLAGGVHGGAFAGDARVGVHAGLEQHRDNAGVAVAGSRVQRSVAILRKKNTPAAVNIQK